ncbi:MAG: thiamine pyrophosphate-binding protein [Armatimonadota bacterium]
MSDHSCSYTVADYIVNKLADSGVEYVYGIPGGSILPVVYAIMRSDNVNFITVRHEATAAFMASAYAKLTGKLGVCMSISGAGTTNMITGLSDAAWDKAPVLAITGQVEQELIGSGVFQEIDQYGLFSSLAYYNQILQKPEQVSEILPDAIRASLQRDGVSHIGIPVDLQMDSYCRQSECADITTVPLGCPLDETLNNAADIINKSRKPIMLVGRYAAEAVNEIKSLSDILMAPVATTPSGKGIYDERRNRSIGVLGRLGLKCSMDIYRESDLAILIGADIVEQRLLPQVPTIQIVTNSLYTSSDSETMSLLAGDIQAILYRLSSMITHRESSDWDTWAMGMHSDCFEQSMVIAHSATEGIHPSFIMAELSDIVEEDAIVALDIGDVTYWYTQYFTAAKQTTLLSAHLASMGFALPASLAAKIAFPERQVLCIAGDGGFGMSMADFTTAVKYDLPIIVLLFNNNSYGRVTGEERDAGLPEYTFDLVNPDFVDFANSCGGFGVHLKHEKDIISVFKQAVDSHKPSLIEIPIDNKIHAMPTLGCRSICEQ